MKRLIFPLPIGIDSINYLSGTLLSIYDSLGKHYELIPVGPLKHHKSLVQRIGNLLKNKYSLFPWRFATMHSYRTVNGFAKQIELEIKDIQYDGIFSVSTLYCGMLNSDKPKFAYTDFSYFNAIDYYEFGTSLFPKSKKEALEIDRACFNNYNLVFLASTWAKNTTEQAYELPQEKIISIGRGANLNSNSSIEIIDKQISKRLSNSQKIFLFVGIDWERKGGDLAFKIVQALYTEGYNVKLVVVGCKPPKTVQKMVYVEIHPFLNRNDEQQLELLIKLYTNAWVFIMPTRAEAMGIVFAEAASFGLPCISNNTGGVSTAIIDEDTGLLFNDSELFQEKVDRVRRLINDEQYYKKLSNNAFLHYKNNLNWDTIALKIKEVIDPILEKKFNE